MKVGYATLPVWFLVPTTNTNPNSSPQKNTSAPRYRCCRKILLFFHESIIAYKPQKANFRFNLLNSSCVFRMLHRRRPRQCNLPFLITVAVFRIGVLPVTNHFRYRFKTADLGNTGWEFATFKSSCRSIRFLVFRKDSE